MGINNSKKNIKMSNTNKFYTGLTYQEHLDFAELVKVMGQISLTAYVKLARRYADKSEVVALAKTAYETIAKLRSALDDELSKISDWDDGGDKPWVVAYYNEFKTPLPDTLTKFDVECTQDVKAKDGRK